MFLSESLTRAANGHVKNGPEDRAPSFRHGAFTGRVDVRGSILRYSSTSKPNGLR